MTQSTAPLTGAPSAGALNAEEIAAIRADFPYLKRPARNGQALAYLDWAATSQKPAGVITTEADFYRMSNGAAGRSTYQLADAVADPRRLMTRLGASSSDRATRWLSPTPSTTPTSCPGRSCAPAPAPPCAGWT